jgi:hypothetical protein
MVCRTRSEQMERPRPWLRPQASGRANYITARVEAESYFSRFPLLARPWDHLGPLGALNDDGSSGKDPPMASDLSGSSGDRCGASRRPRRVDRSIATLGSIVVVVVLLPSRIIPKRPREFNDHWPPLAIGHGAM